MEIYYSIIKEIDLLYVKSNVKPENQDFSTLRKRSVITTNIIRENNLNKYLLDYTTYGLSLDQDTLYNITRNSKQFFDFPTGTKMAIYEGKKYSEEKSGNFEIYLKSFNVDFIRIFKTYIDIINWFGIEPKYAEIFENLKFTELK